MSEIQAASAKVQSKVYANNYYVALYHVALIKHNMSTASIDQHEFSDEQLIAMWNTFWFSLPDGPEIRRDPFFDICDICESEQ